MIKDQDFFNNIADFKRSDQVYIIGSGPNGLDALSKIDSSKHIVVLNGACQYPIKYDHWFCFDHDICNKSWFEQHYMKGHDKSIFSYKMQRLGGVSSKQGFEKDPNLGKLGYPDELIHGVLRGGATIAGAAFQACLFAGYQAITLVGIDMYGDGYFYNNKNSKPQTKAWKQIANFNHLLEIGKRMQVNTTSLSKTMLNL